MMRRIPRKVPVKKISDKQRDRNKAYAQTRADNYDPHETDCQIRVKCNGAPAAGYHHTEGRAGELLTDITKMLRACTDCHKWAEENPAAAKELQISKNRLYDNSND